MRQCGSGCLANPGEQPLRPWPWRKIMAATTGRITRSKPSMAACSTRRAWPRREGPRSPSHRRHPWWCIALHLPGVGPLVSRPCDSCCSSSEDPPDKVGSSAMLGAARVSRAALSPGLMAPGTWHAGNIYSTLVFGYPVAVLRPCAKSLYACRSANRPSKAPHDIPGWWAITEQRHGHQCSRPCKARPVRTPAAPPT
jgi:hypothetical protein